MKMNIMVVRFKSTAVLLAIFMLFAVPLAGAPFAEAEPRDVKIKRDGDPLPQEIEDSFAYLFELIHNRGGAFDPARVAPMIDFVDNCDEDPKDLEPKRRGGRGAILRMDIDCDLERVLKYLYNPKIPNYVIVPSVLRLSGWREGSDILKLDEGLWDKLGSLNEPVVLWGKEFESNTPDSFAGAYYLYDLHRLVILLNHNGKNVLISVTDQDGESDVGRKGAIVNDATWTYFYSGIEGLDRGLLSWMDTYMYSSCSVQVFVEKEGGWTRDVLFKWLKAGWSGLNVVMRKHIFEGSVRFSESFKAVLESDRLPPSEELADMVTDINAMPDELVDDKIRVYARTFEFMNKNVKALQKKEFAKVLKDGGYADVLDRRERVGVLVLQKLKCLLGMKTYVDMCGLSIEPDAPETVTPESEDGNAQTLEQGKVETAAPVADREEAAVGG
jgi:hypothetical protein